MSEPSAIDTGRDGPESGALAGGWLVNIDGDEIVEMTRVQVVASFGSGRIQEHTLIWHEGMDDWLPLVQVPAFRLLSLRESAIPESGARVKTRSQPPPKPLRRAVTETGLAPPAVPTAVAGSRPYGDAETTTDSVTLSREALELLGRDVLEIAESEALGQQTSDSITVARALLDPNLDVQSDPPAADDTSVLAVYDRPIATIEFPNGDESTPGAKLDDDPTRMRAPIPPAAPPPARKITPIAFPPPAPQKAPEASGRPSLPAPITSPTPRSTMPVLRQPEAPPRFATTIRPAAGTPAVRANTLAPAPERRPPMRNPPPTPVEGSPQIVSTAPAPIGSARPAPVSPTPVGFTAQTPPVSHANGATLPIVVPTNVAPAPAAAPRAAMPAAVAPVTPTVPPPMPAVTPTIAPALPAVAPAPIAPAFRSLTPSLVELDTAALRGGRRVPLSWAVAGCLASAAVASIVTAILTAKPQAPVMPAAPVATVEPPKASPPIPPPAPSPPPASVEPAPSADLTKAVAAPATSGKPKRAPAAWKPRPKPKQESDSPYESPAPETTPVNAPNWQGDPSGLEKPATVEAPGGSDPAPAPTFNPGF